MLALPLVGFLLATSPRPAKPPEAAAALVVEAFRRNDITLLRDDLDLDNSGAWADLREPFEKTRCITINDHAEILESSNESRARVLLFVDGNARVAGDSARASRVPPVWYVDLKNSGGRWIIASAITEEHVLA